MKILDAEEKCLTYFSNFLVQFFSPGLLASVDLYFQNKVAHMLRELI
jgi:hypothetical protein